MPGTTPIHAARRDAHAAVGRLSLVRHDEVLAAEEQENGAHPERFVRQPPRPPVLPGAVWINPPKKEVTTE